MKNKVKIGIIAIAVIIVFLGYLYYMIRNKSYQNKGLSATYDTQKRYADIGFGINIYLLKNNNYWPELKDAAKNSVYRIEKTEKFIEYNKNDLCYTPLKAWDGIDSELKKTLQGNDEFIVLSIPERIASKGSDWVLFAYTVDIPNNKELKKTLKTEFDIKDDNQVDNLRYLIRLKKVTKQDYAKTLEKMLSETYCDFYVENNLRKLTEALKKVQE